MTRLLPPTPASRALTMLAGALATGVLVGGRWGCSGPAVLVVAVVAVALAVLPIPRAPALLAGGALLLGAIGAWRGGQAAPPAQPHGGSGATVLHGVVRDAPVAHGAEAVVVVDVTAVAPPAPGVTAVALAVLGRSTLLPGDRVEVQASGLRDPAARPGPLSAAVLDRGGVDAVAVSPRVTLLGTGGASIARTVAVARADVAATVWAAAPDPQATLTTAIAFGVRGRLPIALEDDLRNSGLLHLVATSGLKVAIVAGLVARLLAVLALGPRTRLLATLAAVGSYVVLAGGGAAATRSALMGGITLGFWGSGRRVEPLPLLALVAAMFLLLDPRIGRDAGFQLSFLGTLGILALAGPIAARVPGPRLLVEPFAVTLAAQVATVSVTATTFGTVSLIGPLANAVAVPLVPPLLVLAVLGIALSAVVPWLGAPLLYAASWLGWAIAEVAHLAARVPGAAITVAAWPVAWTAVEVIVVVGLLMGQRLWRPLAATPAPAPARPRRWQWSSAPPRRVAAAGAVLVAAAVATAVAVGAARPDGRLHVSVLAAGAGPAVLVRTSGGGLALVDAGGDSQALLTALGAALPPLTRTLDEVILTGGERAAIGGLTDLTSHYRVTRVVVPDADLGTTARAAVLALRGAGAEVDGIPMGAPWSWAGASWRCVPAGPQAGGALAQPLCALQVRDGTAGALLLGDMGPPAQEEVVAAAGDGLRCDVVVAPPTGLLAPSLVTAAAMHHVAVPGARPPGVKVAAVAPQRVGVRSTGSDGTLAYATGGSGALEPA